MQYGILRRDMTSFTPAKPKHQQIMRSRIYQLIPIAIVLVSFGCATGDIGGSGQSDERRAATLAQNGDYAGSAASYIGLAANASGPERDRLTLLAVQNWLDSGDGRQAKSALREVQKPASGQLLMLWSTNVAAMRLYEGLPDEALQILDPLSQQALTKQHRSRAEALRADAWFQKGNPSRALSLYMQRENWLDTSIDIQRNRERMWAGLMVSNPQQMREAAEVSSDDISRGWLRLGALAASTGLQGIGWANGVQRWQESFSLHPAMGILDNMVLPDAGELDFPRRIALLLPTSGKNAAAGKAIQNGFFGAYFAAAAGLDDEQHVTVYDVANGGVVVAYARAVEDGAEFVVGPLLRRNVEILAAEPVLSVPVLSLNYRLEQNQPMNPPKLIQRAYQDEQDTNNRR
jgi:outer membrane PBP1 activator LpoA protein